MRRLMIFALLVSTASAWPLRRVQAESRDTFLRHYHLRDGSYKTLGFRIEKIRKGSIYDRIGLENGDVIKKINSKPIKNSDEAKYVFQELKTRKKLYLVIERKGQEIPLHYSLK